MEILTIDKLFYKDDYIRWNKEFKREHWQELYIASASILYSIGDVPSMQNKPKVFYQEYVYKVLDKTYRGLK